MIHPMAGGMAPVFTSASSGRNHGYASRASMKLGIIRTNADYGQIRKLVSLTQSRDGTIIIHDLELSWPIPPCTTESSSKGIHPFLLLQYQHARQAFDYKLVSVVCLRDIRTMMQQGPFLELPHLVWSLPTRTPRAKSSTAQKSSWDPGSWHWQTTISAHTATAKPGHVLAAMDQQRCPFANLSSGP
ncbi:hypothetical protein BDP67DRAFT_487281 [Colletotrichum lupini]|nr:hypothetical protein BDP67DRAFT_487281 [Colletotrichum lupini]